MVDRATAKRAAAIALLIGSVALMGASFAGAIKYEPTQVIGFVTGAWGVYLVILENVWNWPIGVVSSAFTVVVCYEAGLFGDMGLNVLYVVLGLLGWYWWLRGGRGHDAQPGAPPEALPGAGSKELTMSALSARGWILSGAALVVLTVAFTLYFVRIKDAAPFLDALTTALSIVAQVLLTRKVLENWIFWIVADVIYIPLYWDRKLELYSVLYGIFFVMAVTGYLEWRRKHRAALVPTHG